LICLIASKPQISV